MDSDEAEEAEAEEEVAGYVMFSVDTEDAGDGGATSVIGTVFGASVVVTGRATGSMNLTPPLFGAVGVVTSSCVDGSFSVTTADAVSTDSGAAGCARRLTTLCFLRLPLVRPAAPASDGELLVWYILGLDDELPVVLTASPFSENVYVLLLPLTGVPGGSSDAGVLSPPNAAEPFPDAQALNTTSGIDGVPTDSVFCEQPSSFSAARFFCENEIDGESDSESVGDNNGFVPKAAAVSSSSSLPPAVSSLLGAGESRPSDAAYSGFHSRSDNRCTATGSSS